MQYNIIRTEEQCKALLQKLSNLSEYVSFDTETTGLDDSAEIIGFSFCDSHDSAVYVILKEWSGTELKTLPTEAYAKDILTALLPYNLIMHNAVFDCKMVKRRYDIDLMPSLHTDTLALAHLLNENESVGLKDLASRFFGDDATKEQKEMKESIVKNGGKISSTQYDLYKADSELIAKYGCADTILTLKVFDKLIPQLFKEGLEKFFYEEETMPLLKGPTYELNTVGLRIDLDKLSQLKGELEADMLEAKSFILKEIDQYVKTDYPGTKKTNTFNIGSSNQLSWLLFEVLGNEFGTLTDGGKELCKELGLKTPYSFSDKRLFKETVRSMVGAKLPSMKSKIKNYWAYTKCDKEELAKLASKYKWVEKLLAYKKDEKLLHTYVEGIAELQRYSIIKPDFKQHGTTSGRYSCSNPNFQNLPRDDKRVKSVIVSRPGKVFIGSDYSQLEPRSFASVSGDKRLQACFAKKEDFYSVVGMGIFKKTDCTPHKEGPNSFGEKYKHLRNVAKTVTLAAVYGASAWQLGRLLKIPQDDAQEILDNYFSAYPDVRDMMLKSHNQAVTEGQVKSVFGRPRRMPEAKRIIELFGTPDTDELPYEYRSQLNLAVNHRIQSTAASIVNRAAIAFYNECRAQEKTNPLFKEVHIVLQVHDELVVEAPEAIAEVVCDILRDKMVNTTELPGVLLEAEPKIANNLADLK